MTIRSTAGGWQPPASHAAYQVERPAPRHESGRSYIRYPETDDRLPRGANVGYNPVSLARFAKATGRVSAEAPLPGDEAWTRWRRQQVSELVRRISIEARAINPRVKVSAAVIAWGRPPRGGDDFQNTAPMQRIFQDWRGWLEDGILGDFGVG